MIITYWVDLHKFAFAPLYMGFLSSVGGFFKKVASVALPVIGFSVAGPIGAAVGGAVGGLASGAGIKGMIIGGLTGYAGGKLAQGGLGGSFFGGGAGAAGGSAVQFGGRAAGLMGMSGTGAGTTAMLSGLAAPSAGMLQAASRGFGTAAGKNVSLLGQVQSAPISSSGLAGKYGHLSGAPKTIMEGVKSVATGTGGGATTNVIQKGALKQGFTFDREKIEELVGAGFSAYEGDIRQQQIDATKQNLSQYKDEFATHYAKEAKAQQEKLARGELPKTYEAALDRESDRLTRLMVAQGHNPAESGFGADTVVRGLMDLESKFIAEERAYWRAIGEGATGMNKYIQELESRQAREPDVGLAGMGELATKAAGTLADLI